VIFPQQLETSAIFSRESGGIAGTIRPSLFNGMEAKTSFWVRGTPRHRSGSQF
jgi:hypothetical protein